MNLNMFDTDSLIISERVNSRENPSVRQSDNRTYNGEIPRFPSDTPLAMAYVPFQQWGDTKSPEDAFDCGTLFSDLVFPFEEVGR
ncbi:MAG: spore coat associated protein CotJA [Ruminococcus flavefaciens]|nr:spore coat associated protein CotJA [Ruminococcus flavefaciens]MCM1229803.1 spore coat associated protein CotJA [Ruminococcus flavefaciens]